MTKVHMNPFARKRGTTRRSGWGIAIFVVTAVAVIYLVPQYVPRYEWHSMPVLNRAITVRVDRWTGQVEPAAAFDTPENRFRLQTLEQFKEETRRQVQEWHEQNPGKETALERHFRKWKEEQATKRLAVPIDR